MQKESILRGMAYRIGSECRDTTVHRLQFVHEIVIDSCIYHTSIITCIAPRVWHFSAFHIHTVMVGAELQNVFIYYMISRMLS